MNQKRIITILTTLALFSIALFTLFGCQPTTGEPAAESSTATPMLSTVEVAVTTATEAGALAEAPQTTQAPTATTVVVETATQTEKMEPTTAPSEATDAATTEAVKPESTAPDSATPIIVYERSGGYAGLTDRWEIYADGRITYDNGNNRVMEWQADPADVTQLHAEIIALDFFALESNYVPKNACCDLFTYSITVTDGTQTHTTTTVDQEPSTPDSFWVILDMVDTFIMANTAT